MTNRDATHLKRYLKEHLMMTLDKLLDQRKRHAKIPSKHVIFHPLKFMDIICVWGGGKIHSDERDKMKWRRGRNQPNGAGGKMTGWGKLWLRVGGEGDGKLEDTRNTN